MATGDSSAAIQPALIAALKGNPALRALVGTRVYDWAPPTPVYPVILVGEAVFTPWDAQGVLGAELQITISIFAKGTNSRAVAKAIGTAVNALLHEAESAISPVGHTVELLEAVTSTINRDEAGDARGTYNFRILTTAS